MKKKKKWGFALLSRKEHKELSSKGGKSANKKGTLHKWTSEEAKLARSKRKTWKSDTHK